jgi:small subunit ribosomal protein S17
MTQTATPGTQTQATKRIAGSRVGTVVSDKRDKTRTVSVEYQTKHTKYGKYLRRQAKFHVHDPGNISHLGDQVQIVTCRPISKTKSWRLIQVIQKAPGQEA